MAERDQLEVDVLFVGAGPASLAGAIRLGQLAKAAGRELEILVIEKGGEIGNHGISGAVMDPRALDELLPDWNASAPIDAPVGSDEMWFLTAGGKIKAPITPPPLNNHGKYVASLQRLTKWMGEKAEEAGAQVFPAFPGQELLWDGDRVDRRAHRRQGTRSRRQSETQLRARRGSHRQGRRLGRRPARNACQAGDSAARTRRRQRAASLRRRRQRAMAVSARNGSQPVR